MMRYDDMTYGMISGAVQIWALILWVSRRGVKRSAYWAYLSLSCSTTENSSLFLSLISESFSLRTGAGNISLPVLFEISSHFLYFFCRAAISSTSTFFLIFAITRSISSSCDSISSFLYSSLCCSRACAMLSRSCSLRPSALSASCRLFMILASFSLALCRDFLSWMEVYGCFLTLSGSFLTAARYLSSMSSFLLTAISISMLTFSWALSRLWYLSSMRCSSLESSSISDLPTLGSRVSCISFSSWNFLSHSRIWRSHSTISFISSAFSSRMLSMLISSLMASLSISFSFSTNSLSKFTFSFSIFCFLSAFTARLSLSRFISCCSPFRLILIEFISLSKLRQFWLSLLFFCSMIVFLFSRFVTFSRSWSSSLLRLTNSVCFFIHSRQSSFELLSNSSVSRIRLISLFSRGFLPWSLALLISSSCSLLSLPTSCCFFSLMSWPCLICTSQVMTRYFFSSCSLMASARLPCSSSIWAFVLSWSILTLAISLLRFSSSISFSSMSMPILWVCFTRLLAVFSMVVCSLFWSISFSNSFLVSVWNFITLASIMFMESSTAFSSWFVILISSSVLLREFFKAISCIEIFSSSPRSSPFFSSICCFYFAIRSLCMFSDSFISSCFLISVLSPFSSLFSKMYFSFSDRSSSDAIWMRASLFCMALRAFCHRSSRFFLLAITFSISDSASLRIFLASSVSSFWEMIWAARMFFCSSRRLLSSFMESMRRSCFFLIFSRLETFSSAVKVSILVTAMSDLSCRLYVSISWQFRISTSSSFWAFCTLFFSTATSSFLDPYTSLIWASFSSASIRSLWAMLQLSCAFSQSIWLAASCCWALYSLTPISSLSVSIFFFLRTHSLSSSSRAASLARSCLDMASCMGAQRGSAAARNSKFSFSFEALSLVLRDMSSFKFINICLFHSNLSSTKRPPGLHFIHQREYCIAAIHIYGSLGAVFQQVQAHPGLEQILHCCEIFRIDARSFPVALNFGVVAVSELSQWAWTHECRIGHVHSRKQVLHGAEVLDIHWRDLLFLFLAHRWRHVWLHGRRQTILLGGEHVLHGAKLLGIWDLESVEGTKSHERGIRIRKGTLCREQLLHCAELLWVHGSYLCSIFLFDSMRNAGSQMAVDQCGWLELGRKQLLHG